MEKNVSVNIQRVNCGDNKVIEKMDVNFLAPGSTDEETVVRPNSTNSDSSVSLASSTTDISSMKNTKVEDGDNSSIKSKRKVDSSRKKT